MKPTQAGLFAGLIAGIIAPTLGSPCALAAPPTKSTQPAQPVISPDAAAAVAAMGKTLQAQSFSFTVRTIRVSEQNGYWVHVFHTSKVTARRPDRLLAIRTGDDGQSEVIYDRKTLVVALDGGKRYASIAVPGTIEGMLHEAVGKLGIDFPIADLLTDDPAKSVMSGVTAGHEVGTVMIDGVECRHLLFIQPDIALELWVEKNEQALPRRLIVTYYTLQGDPEFIAEFGDWKFDVHPSDADFVFQAPPGAVKVALRPAYATGEKQ
jgi:hypothetical protein